MRRWSVVVAVAFIALLPACGETGSTYLRSALFPPASAAEVEVDVLRECLSVEGFDAPRARPLSTTPPTLPPPVDAHTGYGGGVDRGSDAAFAAYEAGLPPSERARFSRVLLGEGAVIVRSFPSGRTVSAPASGCAAQGRIAAFGSVAAWLDAMYLSQEMNEVTAAAVTDQRVVDAETVYQGCMAGAGISARTPWDAVALAQATVVPGRELPSGDEMVLAVHDDRCRASSGFEEAVVAAVQDRDRVG